MKHHIVLFHTPDQTAYEQPLGFACSADDADHAKEQCVNAHPTAHIVWVWQGNEHDGQLDTTLRDYHSNGLQACYTTPR